MHIGSELKLIKFWAEQCNPCKSMDPIVREAIEDTNLELVNINIDNDQGMDMVRKYKIRQIPALLLVKENEVVDKLIGSHSLASVKAFIAR